VEHRSATHAIPLQYSLDELEKLTQSAGANVIGRFSQQLKKIHPGTLIGGGKVSEIRAFVAERQPVLVIFDEDLNRPATNRAALQTRVIDRSQLILDIFAQRARSNEENSR
jgi:GTP-binding protein HflX